MLPPLLENRLASPIKMEAVLHDPAIPFLVLCARKTLRHARTPRGTYKNAYISVVDNSKTLETTQISNDSRRDKLWYFYVMDLKTNEQQLVHQNGWTNHKTTVLFHVCKFSNLVSMLLGATYIIGKARNKSK